MNKNEARKFKIIDFLTEEQIQQCARIGNATDICEQVIAPNIEEINRKLGQENNPKYLAYAVEYALLQAKML